MGWGIRDGLPFGHSHHVTDFLSSRAESHVYMVYVGVGWAMARLPRFRWRRVTVADPLMRWLVLDGFGFHQAYYDKAFTFGIKVTSSEGTSELMSYYPDAVKDWIRRNGGLTTEMKKIKNGEELWKIVDPCPEEW